LLSITVHSVFGLTAKMPTYVTLFAVGLPTREIAVTASARRQSDHPQAALQSASW
jgi:hypothetical protein